MNTSMENLQTLVSEADACNTRINKTLNDVVEANGGKEPFHSQLLACHKENDACGKKHGEIATWCKEHEAEFHAPDPELPPVEIPGMPPAGTIVRKPARFKVPVTETPNHIQVEGPSRPSIAVADGKQVWLGYSVNPDEFIEGQASQSNGTAMIQVPAGIFWMSWKLSPGMGGSTPGDISVY